MTNHLMTVTKTAKVWLCNYCTIETIIVNLDEQETVAPMQSTGALLTEAPVHPGNIN